MILWVDDIRDPVKYGYIGVSWAQNYDEAICLLETEDIDFASLDHDLTTEQTLGYPSNDKSGYDILLWIEEHNAWPENGIICHSQNPVGRLRMLQVIQKHYGKLFQPPWYLN